MRKLLSILMAFSLCATSASWVIACGKKFDFDSNIWVITDAGMITDKSFNESAWDGASQYVVSQKDVNQVDWKKSKWRASYFEPVQQTPADFKRAYLTSKIAGAKTLVLPGFQHGNTIGMASSLVDNIIYIDGSSQGIKNSAGEVAKNVIGLKYEAESSGFFAGIATNIWLNLNQDRYQDGLKIATFGGMDNPGAVSNYMWGFLVASDIWNGIITSNLNTPHLNALKTDVSTFVNSRAGKTVELKQILKSQNVLNVNESWFSQSFEAGHGKDISDELLDRKSSVIFPVAGPQTKDTIDRISYNNSKAKVIGVDVNQSLIYGTDVVLTSAKKEIVNSTSDALKNIYSAECGYNINNHSWDASQQSTKCWLNTDQSSMEHPNWTGIEITPSTPKETVDFIHNESDDVTKNTPFDKIVDALQKVYTVGVNGNDAVANNSFSVTLTNTYENQTKLKDFILAEVEKTLAGA